MGNDDTYIDLRYPQSNYNSFARVHVHAGDVEAALIRFELPVDIPTNANISSATLWLYSDRRSSASQMIAQSYYLLRPWETAEATWRIAARNQYWSVAGANGRAKDRVITPSDEITLNGVGEWASFDITEPAQIWISNPAANYGIVIFAGTIRRG